ncbi:MAG TPA: SRPBCC domain-containing protein [Pseudonocardiaceae bacterium]|nr:SRPBCC domain-containing protein [Pseudonocardiaceae bacterium]
MTESTTVATRTVQVHRVYIKATAQQVWDAITDPTWNGRYGYQCPGDYDLRPGGAYVGHSNAAMQAMGAPDPLIDGEIISVDAPHRLVQTWRALFDDSTKAEGFTQLTWEIDENPAGLCRLTVTHDVTNAPLIAAQTSGEMTEAGGGWAFILSDMKTMLETGKSFQG